MEEKRGMVKMEVMGEESRNGREEEDERSWENLGEVREWESEVVMWLMKLGDIYVSV